MHNVYNEVGSETFELLNWDLQRRPFAEHSIIGDMNVQHPIWGGPRAHVDTEAQRLLEIMNVHFMGVITEEGVSTWHRNEQFSVINLTIISCSLTNRLFDADGLTISSTPPITSLSERGPSCIEG